MKRTNALLVFAVLLVFLVTACGNTNKAPTQTGTTNTQPVNEITSTETDAETLETVENEEILEPIKTQSDVKEFRITAKQFAFEPATIELNKGDNVRLIVTSTDVPHGISIPEYGINEKLPVNEPVTIEFTANKQGTFTAFCSVFCGSGHKGMRGTIVVE